MGLRRAAALLLLPLFFYACGQSGGSAPSGGSQSPGGSCYTAPSRSSTGNAATAITGTVYYEDRTYDANGFTGAACLPVRDAKVEALKGGVVVAGATTDAAGSYSLTLTDAGTYYIRVLAQSVALYAVTVKDDSTASVYAVRSADIAVGAGDAWNVPLSAGISGAGPAFNIYDNIEKAQGVLMAHSPGVLPLITANWYSGKTSGTYYYQLGSFHAMDLLGADTDSDAYDDSVILHEMGHYAAAVFSKDSSPGGSHSLIGHYDLRLTWSEGWANFFSSLIKAELGEADPHLYVDTNGGNGTGAATLGFMFDIALPTHATYAIGADNELAVANVLWHIYAPGASPYLGLGFGGIWTDFTQGLTQEAYVTFEGFYDHWSDTAGQTAAQLAPLLADRSIKYYADAYEDDSAAATARVVAAGAVEEHTLFAAGDKDWYRIAAAANTSYTFSTAKLGDGADTLMTLYDSDGVTQLAQNDDTSTGTTASTIIYTPAAAKTLYLAVEPYRPLTVNDFAYVNSSTCSVAAANCYWTQALVKYGYYSLYVQ